MKKNRTAGFLMALALLTVLLLPGKMAEAEEAQIIANGEELALLREDPEGNYVLGSDIDMTGTEWVPFEFRGTLDGNGYAVLNLTVTGTGTETAVTVDGNFKAYDTCFAGLFSRLEHAEVRNLTLLGERVEITDDRNCYAAGLAGEAEDSTVENCVVSGSVTLTSSAKVHGVGGLLGFAGGSTVRDSVIDTELVCIDTAVGDYSEQFLGGAYAAGITDLENCRVTLNAYISEHGYVHSGGLTGLYILWVNGFNMNRHMSGCTVGGSITFFEDNPSRRAYCAALIGENCYDAVSLYGSTGDGFESAEVKTYDENLLPHSCANPVWQDTPAEDKGFGCTQHTCTLCGYRYYSDYLVR